MLVARLYALPFQGMAIGQADREWVTVAKLAVSTTVELATGAQWPKREGFEALEPVKLDDALSDVDLQLAEGRHGPTTRISRAGWEMTLAGHLLDGCRMGDLVVSRVDMPDDRMHAVVFVVGGEQRLRLPLQFEDQGYPRFEAAEGVAAIVDQEAVHFFRRDAERGLQSVSVSTPRQFWHREVRIADRQAYLLPEDKLLVIDLDELPWGEPHRACVARYEPVCADGWADDEPAVVASLTRLKILADHPQLGRLRLPRHPLDPKVAKGFEVRIEEMVETLPGRYRVDRWSFQGKPSEAPPERPEPLELAAPEVAPLPEPVPGQAPPAVATNAPTRLALLAEEHGFAAPPLLDEILRRRRDDPLFRHWLDGLGFDAIEVRALVGDWQADPCLLAFSGLGNGDEYCLYPYPPWCEGGREPFVALFAHEVMASEFVATTFEAFFVNELNELEGDDDTTDQLVEHLRRELSLPSEPLPIGDDPGLLPPEDGVVSIEDANALLEAGDLLAAERAWVTRLIDDSTEEEAIAALRRIYGQLGWTLPLAHLRELD